MLGRRKKRPAGQRRIRIESLLQAGHSPPDIAWAEGVSRQRVHQIKLALAEQHLGDDASVASVMTRRAEQEPRIGAYSGGD